ncbi:MarR family winged helix-turn-helix transcriptional regulator [Pelagibacterium halotolerans]|uniref:Transcriptional regulator, MarR family n=1 Tax=Pelagibacterium halotolerans (strain DSM 22347 / JCM 15775 / CGMCC 1.7692 / B2) TaxID=1082931 RepID=G4RFE5_PELHB|nr:MarR family transcriptional regulator [Pelagibacterium halotolerans]AEQ51983.1 transcriptional regulator, MarR family [Pelagibacterium halotolerans B2]QJR18230.1 MarR family transcriptional regulator [Pelagibacterium halotolerans]SDZ80928.1 DNA-binding transcriptional regulator, MarR family [Pelagibacterium halotolerans]
MFDYQAATPHWVNRLSFLIRAEVQQRFKAAGYAITAEEWAMLMLLWPNAPQSMGQLAAVSLRDRTTVTRLVDSMVAKGLLERTPAPNDRRSVLVDLGPKGRALEAPLTAIVGDFIAQATKGLSADEIARANAVLQKMTANILGENDPLS